MELSSPLLGKRVHIAHPSPCIRYASRYGTIIQSDNCVDYYIVQLDKAAYDLDNYEELPAVRECIDNLTVLP